MTGSKYDHVRMIPVHDKTSALCAYPLTDGDVGFDTVTVVGWLIELDLDLESDCLLHYVQPVLTAGANVDDYYAVGIVQYNGTVLWDGSVYACTDDFKKSIKEAIGKATH